MDQRYRFDPEQLKRWKPIMGTSGMRRVLSRKQINGGVPVYPGIVSDDRRTIALMAELADTLTGKLSPQIDDTGVVGENGVAGDFLQLRTVAGYGMRELSIPPVDNTAIRETLNLATGFRSARHRRIADELICIMFSEAVPAKVSIRRAASTGAPDFTSDIVQKKTLLRTALRDIDKFLELVDTGNLMQLFVDYNAVIVSTIGQRTQADKVVRDGSSFTPRQREANDELAARSGLRKGKRFQADKRVVRNGVVIADHFAGRRRTVFGMSFVPNYVMASVFAGFREHYLNEYEFTWKHRGPESILDKMRTHTHMMGFDVKQFDQSVPSFLIDHFCSELSNYVDHRVAKLISLSFKAPYIMPHPVVGDIREDEIMNPLFGSSPFDVGAFEHNVGLPSGIAVNPDFGKFAMTWQYLVMADTHFGDVLEFGIRRVLKGEHPGFALLNMGDDAVLLTSSTALIERLRSGDITADYFHVEPESPISFLGNVPFRTGSGELALAPNIISFFVNWLVPEWGVDNWRRRDFWAIGERERRQHYAKAPAYGEAYSIYEEIFHKYVGRSPSSIGFEYYSQQKQLNGMSFIDALVLQNPDYLHYRFDASQVSPEVLELIQTSIPAEEVWASVAHLYKG